MSEMYCFLLLLFFFAITVCISSNEIVQVLRVISTDFDT